MEGDEGARRAADMARKGFLTMLDRCERLGAGNGRSEDESSWVHRVVALAPSPWVGSACEMTVERGAAQVAKFLLSLDAATQLDPRCLGVGEIMSIDGGFTSIRTYRFR